MAELADAPDLGSGGKSRAGSSPVIRTRYKSYSLLVIGLLFFIFTLQDLEPPYRRSRFQSLPLTAKQSDARQVLLSAP